MDYCTIEDIETQTSTPTLIQLTSDDGQEEVDRVVAQEAILYSSTLIDGYLRGRYTLPLDTHFPLLRILAIDLSIYRLYTRRMRNEMPEVIEDNYKNAIATLRDIQKGVITLQSENDSLETASFNAAEYKTNKDIIDRLFSKERMLESLKNAMMKIGITGMTVSHVMGCGTQKGFPEYYRGVVVEPTLLPKIQVDIVVSKVPVRDVIETAKSVLYTGHIGDGKIFVYDVENVVKVRTGEEGYDALQDEE